MSNGTGDSNTSGATQAKLRFTPMADTDQLSPLVVDELSRRGYVVIDVTAESNVLIQPTEPDDKTKIWWPSDINGVPQGQPRIYDTQTGAWVPINSGDTPYTAPQQRNGSVLVAAGSSTQTFGPFADIGTTSYQIILTPTLYWDGTWHTPPGSFPANFGYFIANQSSTLFTCQFYGIPTGGLAWQWQATAIPTADEVTLA